MLDHVRKLNIPKTRYPVTGDLPDITSRHNRLINP